MGVTSPLMHKFKDSLRRRMPQGMASLLFANESSRVLQQVDATLLVFDDKLYDVANGTWQRIIVEDAPRQALANAAAALLQSRQGKPSVLLLLPSAHFVATLVSMPGLSGENLRSALQLQSTVLLPSVEVPLAFVVNAASESAHSPHLVLWTDAAKLESLFDAFAEAGLLLAGVMPRALAAIKPKGAVDEQAVAEQDAQQLTHLRYDTAGLTTFLQIPVQDLQDAEFAKQWQESTQMPVASSTGGAPTQIPHTQIDSAEDYLALGTALNIDADYCYVPAAASALRRQADKGRRIGVAIAAALVLAMLGSLPFLWQTLQIMRLQSQLQNLQLETVQAREDQTQVREFERSWGVLTEFPRQNISQTLLQLQSLINPGVLTSLEIDEGSVEIEGESADPQSLLKTLEQDGMFTGVDFARATNNNRYYIEFLLSAVDYDAYRQFYFPNQRR